MSRTEDRMEGGGAHRRERLGDSVHVNVTSCNHQRAAHRRSAQRETVRGQLDGIVAGVEMCAA